jgi:hypothetical protein
MHCDSTKDIWDKFQNFYEGDAKVKGGKIQTYIVKFEQLKMKEDEDKDQHGSHLWSQSISFKMKDKIVLILVFVRTLVS